MIARILTMTAVALLGGAVLSASLPGAADARSDRGIVGTVKTCSTYGNGCTTAPVRRGRNGYEFRMPGGTWIECRRDCRQALRQETVDFWETQRENQRDR
jgi:hypothetical protein